MMRRWLPALLLLGLLGAAWAQPDPDNPDPNLQRAADRKAEAVAANLLRVGLLKDLPTLAVALPRGVFVLRNGTLARLDGKTLKTQAVVDLFEADPVPADDAALAPMEVLKRLYPAAITPRGDELLVVLGDRFFRVNLPAMTVPVASDIAGPFAFDNNRWQELAKPPTLLLAGDVLTVIRATQVIAVNVPDGKLLATGFLPPELEPPDLAGLRGKGNPARGNDPRNAVEDVIVTGTLVLRTVNLQDVWSIELPEHNEYQLEDSPVVAQMTAAPNAEGARVRILGKLRRPPGLPPFADGLLQVVEYTAVK